MEDDDILMNVSFKREIVSTVFEKRLTVLIFFSIARLNSY